VVAVLIPVQCEFAVAGLIGVGAAFAFQVGLEVIHVPVEDGQIRPLAVGVRSALDPVEM
jgi:hypothetical protein